MGWGTDAEIDTYRTMIADFEKAYPNVKVEYIVVADNEFDTKLQSMIGAGSPPDVFYCMIDNFMKYTATGNLLNLSSSSTATNLRARQCLGPDHRSLPTMGRCSARVMSMHRPRT